MVVHGVVAFLVFVRVALEEKEVELRRAGHIGTKGAEYWI